MSILKKIQSNPTLLTTIRQGVERECLRVNSDFELTNSEHPKAIGSKLTHPFITTDYSESLLEFITGVFSKSDELIDNLSMMHDFTYQKLENEEYIWPWSMPAKVTMKDSDIKVAHFGTSNTGRLKELYRIGLGHRYGKSMQSIAGVHFNFSFTDDFWKEYAKDFDSTLNLQEIKNQGYFKLIRNYRRYSGLLMYLFGSTPVVHESFLKNKKHNLGKLGFETWGKKYATSLRMGGLGYTSGAQDEIGICYNALSTYIKTLEGARLQSFPPYEKIGLKDENGFKQLNTNLLQIDNEFYSRVRPKNIAKSGQSALQALHERGIEYVEVRLLDVNPFSATGIEKEAMRFMHAFLLFCLCEESPLIKKTECQEIDDNFSKIVNEGRDPELMLNIQSQPIAKDKFFNDLMVKIMPYIELLDKGFETDKYKLAYEHQKEKLEDIQKLPSQKVLSLFDDKTSIVDGIGKLAKSYKEAGMNREYDPSWDGIASDSIAAQTELENDKEDFELFLSKYFEQIRIKFEDKNV
jgi:glutamate--cysteine ligase